MKRAILAGGLGLTLGWLADRADAQDLPGRNTDPRPATACAPLVSLGRPIPLNTSPSPSPVRGRTVDAQVRPASYRSVALSQPTPIIRAQGIDPGPAAVMPPPAPVHPGMPTPADDRYNTGVVIEPPPGTQPSFGRRWLGWMPGFGGACAPCDSRRPFESDPCFQDFISPVTNPFLFEDPRSLTEIRPIFIWQKTPSENYVFNGGNIEYFGMQARLAFTDRLSLVMNKLGWIWIEPRSPWADPFDNFGSHSGFSEIQLGPKYTIVRNDSTGTLFASGLTFVIPAGPSKVFQDTGNLSLIPYVSFGQNFGTSQFGAFNFLSTIGYSFGVDNQRTDFFYTSLHLDYDVARLHKIYPLIELNWLNYTQAGTARGNGFEGRDLINFGSRAVSGTNELSMAVGARYKFREAIQLGAAAEFPLINSSSLLDFRLTVDLIFRY